MLKLVGLVSKFQSLYSTPGKYIIFLLVLTNIITATLFITNQPKKTLPTLNTSTKVITAPLSERKIDLSDLEETEYKFIKLGVFDNKEYSMSWEEKKVLTKTADGNTDKYYFQYAPQIDNKVLTIKDLKTNKIDQSIENDLLKLISGSGLYSDIKYQSSNGQFSYLTISRKGSEGYSIDILDLKNLKEVDYSNELGDKSIKFSKNTCTTFAFPDYDKQDNIPIICRENTETTEIRYYDFQHKVLSEVIGKIDTTKEVFCQYSEYGNVIGTKLNKNKIQIPVCSLEEKNAEYDPSKTIYPENRSKVIRNIEIPLN